jgi:hypothetical protein
MLEFIGIDGGKEALKPNWHPSKGKAMNVPHLRELVAVLLASGVLVLAAAWAQQQTVTDVGTLDKAKVYKAFKKPYSPYADRT